MKKVRLMGLVLAASLAVGAVMPGMAQDDNVLVMARAADATGLDPHTQTAFASFRLLELIYEPLVQLDENLNLVPGLAESWEFSDDSQTLTMHLREGVTFHNGADLTALLRRDVLGALEGTPAHDRAGYHHCLH